MTLTALVPLTVLTVLQLSQFERSRESTERQQMRLAQELAQEIQTYIDQHLRATNALAHRLETTPPKKSGEISALLPTLLASFPGFTGLYVLDSAGIMTAAAPASLSHWPLGSDYSDRPYFQKTMQLKAPVVSSIRNGRNITRKLLVILNTPFFDAKGEVRGVVMAPLALQALWSMIEARQFGKNAYAVVSDAMGNAVFFPGIGIDGVPMSIANEATFALARQHKTGQTTHTSAIRDETVFTTYQELEPLGWQVWISVPTARLTASANRALASALALMVGVLLVTALVGAMAARHATRTLDILLHSIGRLSRGESGTLPPDLPPTAREIHVLFERFHAMAEQVESSRKQLLDANRSLAALVDQRTARLEGKLGEMAELAHLLALPAGQRQTDSVEPTIERFRHLLGLTRLEFEAVPAPAPPATPCHARLAVAFGASNFGTLVAQGAAPLDRACLASLEQLASSLAIVLN
ncbi:MAG: cache domain-containing protein, partial [Burkholderiaceae bacterium]